MKEKHQTEGLDLAGILRVLRRRGGVIVLAVIFAVAGAAGFSLLQNKKYSATASLLFRDPGLDQKLFGSSFAAPAEDPARQADTNLELVSLDVVAVRTAKRLGGEFTSDAISRDVEVSSKGQSDLVSVKATSARPSAAAAIANAFASEFIAFRREADRSKVRDAQRLVDRQLARLPHSQRSSSLARSLQSRSQDLRILASLQTGNAELVELATPPSSPSSPKPKRNDVIGGFAGLLLGILLALTLEQLDRRLKRPEELEEVFHLPILATVPKSRSLAFQPNGAKDLGAAEGEAFRMLRANMRYFNVNREIRSVLITSAAPQDGKSTVALNLAIAAGESGTSVLLLEADMRHPSLARLLGVSPAPEAGLTSVLAARQMSLMDVGWRVPVGKRLNGGPVQAGEPVSGIDVVFAGPVPPNPTELLESEKMRAIIQQGEQRYGLVVIDAPPITTVSDAIPLLGQVSGVLVVSRLGSNTRDRARALSEQLENLKAPVLGVVANFATDSERIYYGYPYGGTESAGKVEVDKDFRFTR